MAETLFNKFGTVVDSGKEIFGEDEPGEVMYIIQDGSVRITKLVDGKPHILAVLGKGDFFGEMAIVTRVRRTATATAASTVRLLSFDRNGFLSMVANNARIALNIIDKLCRRLQAANSQIQVLANKNETGMIYLNIYYAFAEGGMENAKLDLHKVARETASNLGVNQERIISIIRHLAERKVIALGNNSMYLVDRLSLVTLAQNAGEIKKLG
jgi:CRP/FNR family transcriptional regulator, cyclic AMP receptor protein